MRKVVERACFFEGFEDQAKSDAADLWYDPAKHPKVPTA
jgi:hypothetical protein